MTKKTRLSFSSIMTDEKKDTNTDNNKTTTSPDVERLGKHPPTKRKED